MPTRTSPSQLDRDIEATVGKRIDRKKLAGLMFSWGSDSSYGQGSGAIGAVASYYVDGKKYPDRKWVERALRQVNEDLPRAKEGAHGWTKADAKTLQTIAAGLRHYLVHDYKAGDITHSTRGRTPLTPHKSHAKKVAVYEKGQRVLVLDDRGHEIGRGHVYTGDNYPAPNERTTWVKMTRHGETATEEWPTHRVALLSKYGHATIKTISPTQMSQLNIAADYGRKAQRAGHRLSPGTDAPFQAWRRSAGLSPIAGNHAWMSGWHEAKNPGASVKFMSAAQFPFDLEA